MHSTELPTSWRTQNLVPPHRLHKIAQNLARQQLGLTRLILTGQLWHQTSAMDQIMIRSDDIIFELIFRVKWLISLVKKGGPMHSETGVIAKSTRALRADDACSLTLPAHCLHCFSFRQSPAALASVGSRGLSLRSSHFRLYKHRHAQKQHWNGWPAPGSTIINPIHQSSW